MDTLLYLVNALDSCVTSVLVIVAGDPGCPGRVGDVVRVPPVLAAQDSVGVGGVAALLEVLLAASHPRDT